ncbi:protein kinase [Sorangium cellulosum]|uniref:Protein kinase n=1 Tax=Sorangium cellulosum TaxID=56 RepID=A0A2L0EL56_SORCE|nr:serine/threonine-protein kinase [Sorangium cellulosum]AUX40020.1 protein kinase [Sorangium cellulosum]
MIAPVVDGDVIAGKYRVDGMLGKGAMGMVVAADHLFLPQRVAIKLLLGDGEQNPGLVQRFFREARAVVRLKNEHVVRVLDFGQLDSGVPYIVMEFLEGEDLAQMLRVRHQLGVAEAADYILQACVGMAEAHVAGIVHRDLKPANLFLATGPGGSQLIKVLDFGISKELPGSESSGVSLTQTRELLGSPIYMPPEQMRSARSVDARSDVWALGAILYRLLTGRPPFEGNLLPELVLQVASTDPPPPSALRREIPPGLEAVILRCLQKDPAQRPPTVADLALALAPFAPPGGQERAERAARILATPSVTSSRPTLPAAAPAHDPGSSAAGPVESLRPTTRVLSRTFAPPGSRRGARVAFGAAATTAVALAIWGALALRRGFAGPPGVPQVAAAPAQDDAAPAQHDAAPLSATRSAAAGAAEPCVAPEPPPSTEAPPPPAAPVASPAAVRHEPPATPRRPAQAPSGAATAPAPPSARPAPQLVSPVSGPVQ